MFEALFLRVLEQSLLIGIILLLLRIFAKPLERHTAPVVRCTLWATLAFLLLFPLPELPLPARNTFSLSDTAAFAAFMEPISLTDLAPGASPVDQAPQHGAETISFLQLLAFLWIGGAAVFALMQGLAYAHFRRVFVHESSVPENPALSACFAELVRELGISRAPELLVNQRAQTPLTIGFLRPILILPREDYTPEEQTWILRHELTHIRRGDVWIKLLFLAANAVHWFNPLAYHLRISAAADLECACDDRMMAGCSFAERRAYSETILSSMQSKKTRVPSLTTQFYGGVHAMKRRIQNILEPAPRRRGVWLAAVLAVLTLTLVCLNACAGAPSPELVDGQLQMGSIFDYLEIRSNAAGPRGLSEDMTAEDVCAYYGLSEDSFEIRSFEEIAVEGNATVPARTFYMLNDVYFTEMAPYPATMRFTFAGEGGGLLRVEIYIQYIGVPWEDAHAHAMSLFELVNAEVGDMISEEEWMQQGDYTGWVANDFGDPLTSLSEFNTNFTRQYMCVGSKNSDGFAVSMSYQDFSSVDTTESMGQDVEELFNFDLTF